MGKKMIQKLEAPVEDTTIGGGMDKREYMRSADVQEMLGISVCTLKNLRQANAIPYYKLGGIFFYKREEILAYIEATKVRKI